MLKNILFFIILILPITTFSYNPTDNDYKVLDKIDIFLEQNIKTKNIYFFEKLLSQIENKLKLENLEENKIFILTQFKIKLENVLEEKFYNKKIEHIELTQDQKDFKKDFFDKYGTEIISGEIISKCTENYDFVDSIGREYDFPTALIIATWKVEYGCNLGNPANGKGPFQIQTHYYTPGEITLEEFGESIKSYIDFSKNKINNFNNNKILQQRYNKENINISYDFYNLEDLEIYSALYNGITKNLDSSTFIYGNINEAKKGSYDGIITNFLKVLSWEIKN